MEPDQTSSNTPVAISKNQVYPEGGENNNEIAAMDEAIPVKSQPPQNGMTVADEDHDGSKYVEERDLESLNAECEELRIVNCCVEYPIACICIAYVIMIILAGISIGSKQFRFSEPGDRDFLVWSDPIIETWDMQTLAMQAFTQEDENTIQPLRTERAWWAIQALWQNLEAPEGVLQKESLLAIKEIEDRLRNDEQYETFCKAVSEDDSSCDPNAIFSPLILFTGMDLESMTQDQINTQFKTIAQTPNWDSLSSYFDNQVDINADVPRVRYCQSLWNFGYPIEYDGTRYANTDDEPMMQLQDARDGIVQPIYDWVEENYGQVDSNGFQGELVSLALDIDDFLNILIKDAYWALGALAFVFFVFVFHLKSCFLGCVGITLILLSFPLTVLLCKTILRVPYITSLHMFAVFTVIGIAADDVFVFTDAWRQSAVILPPHLAEDKKKRMAYTFRRASRAMAMTSSTTCAAFLANALSPLMPIKSFGIYAGLIVPINFLLVVCFFPPAVIILEAYLKNVCNCLAEMGFKPVEKPTDPNDPRANVPIETLEHEVTWNAKLETFFATTFTKAVEKFRYGIFLICLIWFCIAAWRTSLLEGLSEEETFIPDSHPTMRARVILRDNFGQITEDIPDAMVFWGTNDIDKSQTSTFNSTYIGELEWDMDFDLGADGNQEWLQTFCTSLSEQEFVVHESVSCWINDFAADTDFLTAQGVSFPVDSASLVSTVEAWLLTSAGSQYERNVGIVDGRIAFMSISATPKINDDDPYLIKKPQHEKWDTFVTTSVQDAPAGMNNFYQTSSTWLWMVSEVEFKNSAIQGIGISMAFSFIIVLFATNNILMAVYAIMSVAFVVVSVVGIMNMKGWQFGTGESITVVIIIGFAVDYVIHLAADYTHSHQKTRNGKMTQAYREMGISILFGMITTAGCGFFLFGCTFNIFTRFAVILSSTCCIAFIASMFLFGALCHTIGPQDGFGDLPKCSKQQPNPDATEQPEPKAAGDEV